MRDPRARKVLDVRRRERAHGERPPRRRDHAFIWPEWLAKEFAKDERCLRVVIDALLERDPYALPRGESVLLCDADAEIADTFDELRRGGYIAYCPPAKLTEKALGAWPLLVNKVRRAHAIAEYHRLGKQIADLQAALAWLDREEAK